MLSWLRAIAVPDYEPDSPRGPPDSLWKADTDGGTLYAVVWGEGSTTSPYGLQVLFRPDPVPGADQPQDSRFPRLEEITSAADFCLPNGVLLSHAPFNSVDPDDRRPVRGLAGHEIFQIGVVNGSPAATRQTLHVAQGPTGNYRSH